MSRRIPLNVALGLVALALGGLAVLGDPFSGKQVTIDTRELAALIDSTEDHLTARELADWILEGRTDYRLIDVRKPDEYARYHIPTAENVPLSGLPDYPLLRNEKIVLYSGGGIHAAQAWMLLKALGYPGVYTVLGGLDAWTDEVLFPTPPAGSDPGAIAEFARTREVSLHFGGQPRAAGGAPEAGVTEMAMPEVEMPPPPPPTTAAKKKRKQGC